MTKNYERQAARAVEWLLTRLNEEGSYADAADDLACYYKSPFLFNLAGKTEEATRVLSFIHRRFATTEGDFETGQSHKSDNTAFNEYWSYPNGWIAMAAQRMGRFEFGYRAFSYLQGLYQPDVEGFLRKKGSDRGSDIFSTAHLGLTCLYFGDLSKARSAGRFLARTLNLQEDNLTLGLFLRVDSSGNIVKEFPAEEAPFYFVDKHAPNQAYFMIGYPIAFLTKLYCVTGDAANLEAARGFVEFALACTGNLRSFYFSHKVGWGAAVFARITRDERCVELALSVADHLVSIQDHMGPWLIHEPAHTMFDQTAEIAIWLKEISSELAQ